MFRRKLRALEHECPDAVDVSNEASFRKLVVWLEDRKIRNYKKEDRGELRDVESKTWEESFRRYLENLACPIDLPPANATNKPNAAGDRLAVIDWLLGYAVRLEYADGMDEYKKMSSTEREPVEDKGGPPKIVSSNPLDKLDFQHPEFVEGVNALADALKVVRHPDHLLTLKACARLVQERLAGFVATNTPYPVPEGQPFPLQESDLGFDTGDYVLNEAAKVLRLLFVHDIPTSRRGSTRSSSLPRRSPPTQRRTRGWGRSAFEDVLHLI
jgi:RLL motif-containing protein 1